MAILLGAFPNALHAQGAIHDWSRLDASGHPIVHVQSDTGSEVTGTLLKVERDSIVLRVSGVERSFNRAQIKRIDRRGDSLKNGALTGAGVGALLGLLAALISDCPGADARGPCPGARVAGFAVSVGAYAAVGVGIDALVAGRTLIYAPPPATSPVPRAAAAPALLRLRFRW